MSNYVLNMSTVLGGLPLVERPAAARELGYTRVESWWDFVSATPPQDELDAFITALDQAQVDLVAINSHGGDRAAGERGLACLPDRQQEFQESITSIVGVSERTGARKFNVTIGEMLPEFTQDEQFQQAARNYRWAAEQLAPLGGTILIEPLSGQGKGSYPFRTGYDVVEFCTQHLAGVANVAMMFDTFHLAANGVDVLAAWDDLQDHVGHVQFADFPGRGAPGTGDLDFAGLLSRIRASRYTGDIAYEYVTH